MQAVRQCTVCAGRATGGLLRNQRDLSPLRINKSMLRSEATSTRFLSTSEGVALKTGVQKSVEWTNTEHMSLSPSSVRRGLAALTFTQQAENLSHDTLIRRAASVVTDSSSTFLSQTTLALVDAITDYSKAVHTRIAVQKRYIASVGKLSPAEGELLQKLINGQRAEVSVRLDESKRFESTWINAVNLCEMAAEAAHTSGAEQASITMRAVIQVAQLQVDEARKLSEDADKKLAETKVEEIQRMAEFADVRENIDDDEWHEAYLRED